MIFVKSFCRLFLFLAAFTGSAAMALETVTLLDRGEPYDAMLADNGLMWIGHSRLQFNSNYRLEVYQPDGALIDRVTLSHSLSVIKSMNNGSIIVTGVSPTSRQAQYTVAHLEGGKIRTSTNEIAMGALITFWITSMDGRQYFADIGGNPDDNSDPGAQLPAQTIFSSTGSNYNYLGARVSMPVAGTSFNGKLLLVSSQGIGQFGSSLVEVDPRTSALRVITQSADAKYRGIDIIAGTSNLVTSALGERKLRVIDTITGKTQREFQTKGYPRTFDLTGHCIVVGNDETNVVEVFDLKSETDKPSFAAEVAMPASEFSGIKNIAVDDVTGMVFARASYPCNPLMESCDQDYNRVVKFDAAFAERIKATCN